MQMQIGLAGPNEVVGGQHLAKVVVVTPEMAKELLSMNMLNRPLSKVKVDRYAASMRAGLWRYNGEGLSIGRSGRLLNGQHRLHAIIASGVSCEMVIAYGVAEENFSTLDSAPGRSGADIAALLGWENASMASACASILTAYDTKTLSWGAWHALSVMEVPAALKKYPGIRESIVSVTKGRDLVRLFRQSWLPAAHFIFARLDEPSATQFIRRLIDGADLRKGDPVYELRGVLVKMSESRRPPLKGEALGMTIRAWNACRNKQIRYRCQRPRLTEEVSDPFPKAI